MLDEEIEQIKVGTVEKFQGSEKEVIIISTVRSQPEMLLVDKRFNLGFVSNKKVSRDHEHIVAMKSTRMYNAFIKLRWPSVST